MRRLSAVTILSGLILIASMRRFLSILSILQGPLPLAGHLPPPLGGPVDRMIRAPVLSLASRQIPPLDGMQSVRQFGGSGVREPGSGDPAVASAGRPIPETAEKARRLTSPPLPR